MRELTIATRCKFNYLELIAENIECDLPAFFSNILCKYAGLKVLENKYKDENGVIWELSRFKRVRIIMGLTAEFKEMGLGLKLPFGHNSLGWHYCLSLDEWSYGKVIVYRWTEQKNKFLVIAENLENFINGLYMEDQGLSKVQSFHESAEIKIRELTIAPRVGTYYWKLIEDALGTSLNPSFKKLLARCAGLRINENIYEDKEGRIWSLDQFVKPSVMANLTIEFLECGYGRKMPFAYNNSWHLCLSFDKESYGKIIVNRWTDHPPEEQFLIIANSLEEFINELRVETDEFAE